MQTKFKKGDHVVAVQDLDISNIESKPTVVVVSNQDEYGQLMQHLEKEGKIWGNMKWPTKWQPEGFDFPYCIFIGRVELTWSASMHENQIAFPDYAAKNIFPHLQEYIKEEVDTIRSHVYEPLKIKPIPKKRDRVRIERSKYDALQFDLKMAQTALENRNKEIDGWVKQNNELRAERDALKSENENLRKQCDAAALNVSLQRDAIQHKASEHARLDTLSRNLRDQRDTAMFIAALFALCALGFAVAVWIGRLIPVI